MPTVANAIAAFEPVTMIANPGADAAAARAACSEGVEVTELPLDDSWLRDCGPIYVETTPGAAGPCTSASTPGAEKFPPWDRDAAVGGLIAEALGDPVVSAPMVLEGGSIAGDGAGHAADHRAVPAQPQPQPASSRRGQIEAALRTPPGVERIVWLGQGLVEDRDTDGHVDLIAAFVDPGGFCCRPSRRRTRTTPAARRIAAR